MPVLLLIILLAFPYSADSWVRRPLKDDAPDGKTYLVIYKPIEGNLEEVYTERWPVAFDNFGNDYRSREKVLTVSGGTEGFSFESQDYGQCTAKVDGNIARECNTETGHIVTMYGVD